MKHKIITLYNLLYWRSRQWIEKRIERTRNNNIILNVIGDYRLGIRSAFFNDRRKNMGYNISAPIPYQCLDSIIKHIQVNDKTNFIDIGCGLGRAVFYFHKKGAGNVTGIDIDEKVIDAAKLNFYRYIKTSKQVNVIKAHALQFDYKYFNLFFINHPFPVELLKKTMEQIQKTATPRIPYRNKTVTIIFRDAYDREYNHYMDSLTWLTTVRTIKPCTTIYKAVFIAQ